MEKLLAIALALVVVLGACAFLPTDEEAATEIAPPVSLVTEIPDTTTTSPPVLYTRLPTTTTTSTTTTTTTPTTTTTTMPVLPEGVALLPVCAPEEWIGILTPEEVNLVGDLAELHRWDEVQSLAVASRFIASDLPMNRLVAQVATG